MMQPFLRKDPPGPGFLLTLYQLRLLRRYLADARPLGTDDVRYADPVARDAFSRRLDLEEKKHNRVLDPDRDRIRLHLTSLEAEGLLGILAEQPADAGLRRILLGQARGENAVSCADLLAWSDRLSVGASLGFAAHRAGIEVPTEAVEANRTLWIETDAVLEI